MSELTDFQRYAIEQIQKHGGDQWFTAISSTTTYVRRPQFTCELLHKKGFLERRQNPDVDSIYSSSFWQYRLAALSGEEE